MGTPSPPQKTRLDRLRDPKRGTKGGGQEKKKVRGLRAWDKVGQEGGQRDEQNRAGWQTKKYRHPDRPKRVETLKSAGVCGTACIGRAKQEKFWEVRQATHTQDGQDRELCPILHLNPEVLHLSNLPRQKKERERQRGEKVFFLGFEAAD